MKGLPELQKKKAGQLRTFAPEKTLRSDNHTTVLRVVDEDTEKQCILQLFPGKFKKVLSSGYRKRAVEAM